MAKTTPFTASGVVKAGSGLIYNVCITKVGTGASAWTIYDNPTTNSGNVVAQGDGLTAQSFNLSAPTSGTQLMTGAYIQLAGTTVPTVCVTFE